MTNYEIRVIPQTDDKGKEYWTAFFPAVEGVVGGGDTPEEAIQEARENLAVFLEYLAEEGVESPEGYRQPSYSGKIALRVPKSVHRKLVEMAEEEGVSLNSCINTAIDIYFGKYEFDYELNKKIEAFCSAAQKRMQLQIAYSMYHATSQRPWSEQINGLNHSGGRYE